MPKMLPLDLYSFKMIFKRWEAGIGENLSVIIKNNSGQRCTACYSTNLTKTQAFESDSLK